MEEIVQQVAMSHTAPIIPVVPQRRVPACGGRSVRLIPDWPSIEARHEPQEPLPYKQDFSFDMSVVMDLVQAVLTDPDPEAALAERLSTAQAAQQVRFAELPDELKSDERVLLRHQHQLRANQTHHDAALKVLRLVAAWAS